LYSIGQFKELNKPERIIVTQHSRRRFSERSISIDDICMAIDNGEIIEYYPEDYPFPSCLILGNSDGRAIHLVASIDENMIYLITAYIPDPVKWDCDLKTRKEESL
jgi:hypothetical protein